MLTQYGDGSTRLSKYGNRQQDQTKGSPSVLYHIFHEHICLFGPCKDVQFGSPRTQNPTHHELSQCQSSSTTNQQPLFFQFFPHFKAKSRNINLNLHKMQLRCQQNLQEQV